MFTQNSISLQSAILVILQFTLIAALFFITPFRQFNLSAGILCTISVLLFIWSAVTMNKSKLRIRPEPALHATLITNGPYRYIRHPMYTSVLLCCAGLLTIQITLPGIFLMASLIMVLLLKLNYEEVLLRQKFSHYNEYCKSTCKLIPYVF